VKRDRWFYATIAPYAIVAVLAVVLAVLAPGSTPTVHAAFKRHIAARIPPRPLNVLKVASVHYYKVKPGDTLSGIAQRFWGSYTLWPRLWNVNHAKITDPNLIYPGEVIEIPTSPAGIGSLRYNAPAPVHSLAASPDPAGSLQQYAQQLLDNAGLGGATQWDCFNSVVERESSWNVHADNPQSGAYGIPQSLPAGKMAAAGPDWQNNGYTQLFWMIRDYIVPTYSTPCGAWAHEIEFGWY
jgi:LysM repeat protein